MTGATLRESLVRVLVILWFLAIAVAVARDLALGVPDASGHLAVCRILAKLCLLSYVLMVAWLTMVRGPALARAEGAQARLSAFFGTNLVFLGVLALPVNADLPISIYVASAALILVGNALALVALVWLGRSFSIMAEARALVLAGPYRIVRHPLYVAEEIASIGVLIQYASIAALILFVAHLSIQIMRMLNEEALLSRTLSGYDQYRSGTFRAVPGIW